MIPDDVIEQVRDAADLVGVVGEYVELKRTGADYRGPCPFHGGTHRNFAVIPKKGMFYCFVCHEGGDVFSFLMKKLGMDYPTAVREVARRVGITVPERAAGVPSGPDPHEPLFTALAAAAEWFARELRESPEGDVARRYLASRDIDLDAVLPFGVGYAPRAATALLDALKRLGVRESVLLDAGLAHKREDGTIVARFRGRLLFPIHDLRARVVAFGGRILGAGEPKYLNSPDSDVFHKGRLLYNLHAAKLAIRKAERAVLVEGYFDVLRLTLAGLEEVVAPLGTGLTAEQAQLLARYTKHVILLYDSDDAGLRATFRAGDELLRHGVRVSVATLPEGDDPDTLVRRNGPAALAQVLKDTVDVFERKIQILERKGLFGSLPGRRRALDRLLPTIRAVQDPITRELYLSRAAEVAGVRRDVLEREAGGTGTALAPGAVTPAPVATASPQVLPAGAEKALLQLLLAGEPWRPRVLEAVAAEDFEFPPYRAVFEAVADDAPERLDETAARTFEQLKVDGLGAHDPDAVFTRALSWIEARGLERQVEAIDRELPLASEDEKMRLVLQKRQLSAEMNARYPKYKIATRRK
jgi:DNA primase